MRNRRMSGPRTFRQSPGHTSETPSHKRPRLPMTFDSAAYEGVSQAPRAGRVFRPSRQSCHIRTTEESGAEYLRGKVGARMPDRHGFTTEATQFCFNYQYTERWARGRGLRKPSHERPSGPLGKALDIRPDPPAANMAYQRRPSGVTTMMPCP